MKYENSIVNVEGENRAKLFLFTLSTCIWCKKTKELLSSLGVAYSYINVDLVEDGREEVMNDMHKYNPATSFPTIVVNDGEKVILGYEENKIRDCVS